MLPLLSYHNIKIRAACGGDEEIRTPDPLRAKQVLSHLSYTPALRFQAPRAPYIPLKILSNLQN
jgi:hypothetical protein